MQEGGRPLGRGERYMRRFLEVGAYGGNRGTASDLTYVFGGVSGTEVYIGLGHPVQLRLYDNGSKAMRVVYWIHQCARARDLLTHNLKRPEFHVDKDIEILNITRSDARARRLRGKSSIRGEISGDISTCAQFHVRLRLFVLILRFLLMAMPMVIVELEKCSGAGVCKSVCPMDVYDLVEMPEYNNETKAVPVRMDDCIMCMACVDSCPEQAITVEEP